MAQSRKYANSWTLILAPVLLLPFFLSPSFAATVCDASLYGNPNPSNCSQILLGNRAERIRGLDILDRKNHLFYAGDFEQDFEQRPSDVTLSQWRNRVHLAMTISRGDCNIFLVPGYSATGMFQYDTGTYLKLADQATKVQNYCSHFPEPEEDQVPSMEGGQGWIGDKGLILAIFYADTSAFGITLAQHIAEDMLPDLRAISAENPPNIPMPAPTCGRSHFCTKSSHCRGAFYCVCVADTWHGEFYSSSCKNPLPGKGNGRGLLEINATQPAFSINGNLTAEGSTDIACPCNCTYVSKACCNSPSGIVYEAPDLKLGSLQAPSVNLTCSTTTGDFQASNLTLDVMLTTRGLVPERSEAKGVRSLTDPISAQEGN